MKNLFFLFILLVFNCCSDNINSDALIGKWEANDGAILELKSDGRFEVHNIDFNKIQYPNLEFPHQKLSFEGIWSLNLDLNNIEFLSETTYSEYGIDNTYTDKGVIKSRRIGFSLNIEGTGLFQNKFPWHLYSYIGDPDELNKYSFRKK